MFNDNFIKNLMVNDTDYEEFKKSFLIMYETLSVTDKKIMISMNNIYTNHESAIVTDVEFILNENGGSVLVRSKMRLDQYTLHFETIDGGVLIYLHGIVNTLESFIDSIEHNKLSYHLLNAGMLLVHDVLKYKIVKHLDKI